MIKAPRSHRLARALPLLGSIALLSCLFNKPEDEVDLALTNVPAGTEQIQVVAVEKDDTTKVLDTLVRKSAWSPGQNLHFSLGAAEDKEWLLRVEGYRDGFLVYLALIPDQEYASDTVRHPDVTSSWPAVLFTAVTRDSASVHFSTVFRGVPEQAHWHLNPRADSADDGTYIPSMQADLSVPVAQIKPGALLTADLHFADNSALPVQLPDSMLADEALSPSGATLKILDAYSVGDSVFIKLDCKNFRLPRKDEPLPGQGVPKALDGRGLRPLAGFAMVGNDSSLLAGPASALDGVDKVVVALHYANNMRVRPPVADAVDAETALRQRVNAPSIRILSFAVAGGNLEIILERQNFQNLHCHITRDVLNTTDYEICHTDTCVVDSTVWKGAQRVIVAAHRDQDHALVRPLVADTLIPPP